MCARLSFNTLFGQEERFGEKTVQGPTRELRNELNIYKNVKYFKKIYTYSLAKESL